MSYLDRIAACRRHDPALYLPFLVDGVRLGAIRRDLLAPLAAVAGLAVAKDSLSFAADIQGDEARQAVLADAARRLAAEGLSPPPRGEPYRVGPRFEACTLSVERAAVEPLGIRAYGVHLTGTVLGPEGLSIWVPRRGADRPTYPGKLDNTVAGGQPAGLGVLDNLVKECGEEAGMPPKLARRARPVGTLSYRLDTRYGLKDDVIFCFDLDCGDFVPVNRDGEVEDFTLWPVQEAMARVAEGDDFKPNCALVLIDFFVRHGLIAADHPNYIAICAGLGG